MTRENPKYLEIETAINSVMEQHKVERHVASMMLMDMHVKQIQHSTEIITQLLRNNPKPAQIVEA